MMKENTLEEGGRAETGWSQGLSQGEDNQVLGEHPSSFFQLLVAPDIPQLSDASLQSLPLSSHSRALRLCGSFLSL